MPSGRALTQEIIEGIPALAARGWTNIQIAQKFGIGRNAVSRYLVACFEAEGVSNRVEFALKYHGVDLEGLDELQD